MTINDQSLNVIGIKETAYGGYLATKLKDQNGPLALLNNDNWMYFALVRYFTAAHSRFTSVSFN